MKASCLVVTLIIFILLVHLNMLFGCHEQEREALSKFKQSFSDPAKRFSSWNGEDCCSWEGVVCNNVTGYINRLDLRAQPVWNFDNPLSLKVAPYQLQAKMLDPSLLALRHLNYMDLSGNDFQGSQVPEFIGSFKHLKYLNLSMASFCGVLPSQLGNLTMLEVLDLDSTNLYRSRFSSDLHWVSELVNLQALDLSGMDLATKEKAMLALKGLPSLVRLRLEDCGLGNTLLSLAFTNSTLLSRIKVLDLSMNLLKNPLPQYLTNMSSLEFLDLSFNLFDKYIPLWLNKLRELKFLSLKGNTFSHVEGGELMKIIGNPCKFKGFDVSWNFVLQAHIKSPPKNFSTCITHELENLDLTNNMITGTLPHWLGHLKNLRRLNVGGNKLVGMIPHIIGSLPYLEELSLSKNGLNGTIPSSLQGLSSLQVLDLSHNFFNGSVPSFVGRLLNLTHLELSNNLLVGTIPEVLGQHKALMRIDLSSNSLEGSVSNSHLGNLSSLKSLDLRFNSLVLNLTSDWHPPFQLNELRLSFCKIIDSQFPQWIQTQEQLIFMDLSTTGISGNLPEWFWDRNFIGLNLSHNHLTGPIKNLSYELAFADLSHNIFSGTLPQGQSLSNGLVRTCLCQLKSLHELDLQNNKLSGTIPDCWNPKSSVYAINLSSNNLSGLIPKSIGLLPWLLFINLNNNSLEGEIPKFSKSRELMILDLGENKLSGEIPKSYSAQSHPSLQILRLRGNHLVGVIPIELCSLPRVQILDIASNNLTGNIPRCLGHLNGMKLLPASSAHNNNNNNNNSSAASSGPPAFPLEQATMEVLKGEELQYTTTLALVVNLDLSSNGLVGSIPEEITNLSGLIGLNLSNNHLMGSIPEKIGEMRLLESLDLSNNRLTGTIPSSMSALTFLSHLNLSYNKLHGRIPTGNQLQTLDDPVSIYAGNPGLCGDSLPNKCESSSKHRGRQGVENDKDDSQLDKVMFYVVPTLGFATGFWAVIGSLLLMTQWRRALFQYVEKFMDYILG